MHFHWTTFKEAVIPEINKFVNDPSFEKSATKEEGMYISSFGMKVTVLPKDDKPHEFTISVTILAESKERFFAAALINSDYIQYIYYHTGNSGNEPGQGYILYESTSTGIFECKPDHRGINIIDATFSMNGRMSNDRIIKEYVNKLIPR